MRIVTDGQDEQTRQAVAGAVDRTLTEAGIAVGFAASVSRGAAASSAHLGPVLLILLAIALPLGLVGVIDLASTMSSNVLDRTREFGVMYAIGGRGIGGVARTRERPEEDAKHPVRPSRRRALEALPEGGRLYVGAERDREIEAFLRAQVPQEQRVAALWWPGAARHTL